ncbi:hypothetical protein BHM03_00010837 [Ensete ventricosum]|nr:hypothetical protein BHM03_00010837 [Ensete ventricosum]
MVAPACLLSSYKIPRATLGTALPKVASAHPAFRPLMTRLLCIGLLVIASRVPLIGRIRGYDIWFGSGVHDVPGMTYRRSTRMSRLVDVPSVVGRRGIWVSDGPSLGWGD